jgi:hypothetical protein
MIDHKIPAQNQELVRDAIACILLKEFKNQLDRYENQACKGARIFKERMSAPQINEMPFVNISLWKGKYSNHEAAYRDGEYSYVIDVIKTSKGVPNVAPDVHASLKCQELMGVIAYILSHPNYRRLELSSPRVTHTAVTDFQVIKPDMPTPDTYNIAQIQMVYTVRCGEPVTANAGVLAGGNDTTVKVQETELGFEYTLNITNP